MRSVVMVLLCLIAGAARADVPPLPGATERFLQSVIEQAGQSCDGVSTYYSGTGGASFDPESGLEPFRVSCANGKKYLVAVPKKLIGPRPDAPKPFAKEIRE